MSTDQVSEDEYLGDNPSKLWVQGDRELYYDLPTLDPIAGYVDRCSMFIDLSYRRLKKLKLSRYVKSNYYLIITHLHLQHNKLTELPDSVFVELENLSYLNASNNDLKNFPLSVKNHEGLNTILLQDNLIEEFPIELGSIEGLKTLGIEFNPMKFPSVSVFKQWRCKNDVIDFFKRCWKNQSRDVPAVVGNKIFRTFKLKKPKYTHVKEPSEIICELKRFGDSKMKKKAAWMERQLQARESEIQKTKDREVLKAWQDNYRRYKNEERLIVLQPPPYDVDERYNRITSKSIAEKIDSESKKGIGYKLDLNQEILGIKERLSNLRSSTRYKDPEGEMAARLKEIKTIRQLQKKIEHLKYRTC